jgi:AraC-like DNA-binding protein
MRRTEASYVEYFINEKGIHLPLRCFLLESGKYIVQKRKLYNHVVPSFNRLFLFKHGGGHIESAQGHYGLKSGAIYLLPVNFSFRVSYEPDSEFYYFHANVMDIFGTDIFNNINSLQCSESHPDMFEQIVSNYAWNDLELIIGWQLALAKAFLLFTVPILDKLSSRWHQTGRYHEVLSYISRNCAPNLSIDELAKQARSSPAALSKGFQRTVGISIKRYITNMLLQRARETLISTDLTIREIAFNLGYADPYHFQKVFKKHIGITPRKYRLAIRESMRF